MPPETPEHILLTWQAPITPFHERTKTWYIVSSIVLLAALSYAVYASSWPLVVVLVLIGFMYFQLHGEKPRDQTFVISDRGVQLEQREMPWEEMEGWWLLSTPHYTELHVVPLIAKNGEMIIQTGTQDIEKIQKVLQEHAKELTEKRERFVDMLIRISKL